MSEVTTVAISIDRDDVDKVYLRATAHGAVTWFDLIERTLELLQGAGYIYPISVGSIMESIDDAIANDQNPKVARPEGAK